MIGTAITIALLGYYINSFVHNRKLAASCRIWSEAEFRSYGQQITCRHASLYDTAHLENRQSLSRLCLFWGQDAMGERGGLFARPSNLELLHCRLVLLKARTQVAVGIVFFWSVREGFISMDGCLLPYFQTCNREMNICFEFLDILKTSLASNSFIQDRIFSVTELCAMVPGVSTPCGSIMSNASESVSYLSLVGLAMNGRAFFCPQLTRRIMEGAQSWFEKLYASITSINCILIRITFRIHSTNDFRGYQRSRAVDFLDPLSVFVAKSYRRRRAIKGFLHSNLNHKQFHPLRA